MDIQRFLATTTEMLTQYTIWSTAIGGVRRSIGLLLGNANLDTAGTMIDVNKV